MSGTVDVLAVMDEEIESLWLSGFRSRAEKMRSARSAVSAMLTAEQTPGAWVRFRSEWSGLEGSAHGQPIPEFRWQESSPANRADCSASQWLPLFTRPQTRDAVSKCGNCAGSGQVMHVERPTGDPQDEFDRPDDCPLCEASGGDPAWQVLVTEKLSRFSETSEDEESFDIGADWANSLVMLGLLAKPRRGYWQITEAGRAALAQVQP